MKIIIYDDTLDFGGHQIMSCHGIEALASDPSNEVLCMIHPDNHPLAEKLAKIESCQTLQAPCSTQRFQSVLNHVDHRGIKQLRHLFGQLQPDRVLCIQGDIEHSSQALIAAHRSGLKCISYMALPHCLTTMGSRFGAWRDTLSHGLFRQPSSYITISESMAGLLRQRGVTQPITVVPNGIPSASAATDHSLSRIKTDGEGSSPGSSPPEQLAVLGMLGRIEFKQKQQDFMVRAFCSFPQAFGNCRLRIAGGGPDRTRLESLAKNSPRNADIDLLPWQHEIDAFFASIDLLVIPSRYEGVPLVMLEALARGIPVIGSSRDGMKDMLPESWTFETENAAALADTFSTVRNNWHNDISSLRQRILANHSLEMFKLNFANAVLGQA